MINDNFDIETIELAEELKENFSNYNFSFRRGNYT